MFNITISGKTTEELLANGLLILSLLGGTSAKAVTVLSDSDQARLRGDAVVVPPSGKEPTAAEKKAAEKAAKKAAAEAAAAETVDEPSDDDVLGENDETEALTQDDVKKLLIEVRTAYPKEATIISTIVKDIGKAAKLSDLDPKMLPAVAAHCRELLAKAAKKK